MRIRRAAGLGALVAASCTTLALIVPPAAATAATAPSSPAARTMLVFLRGPAAVGTSTSAGRTGARVQSSAASLVRSLGATVLARTSVPNTLTVRLTAASAATLARSPLVAAVLADSTIPGPAPARTAGRPSGTALGAHAVSRAYAKASCGTAAHPQLNPEALGNVNAPAAWAAGATGKGVKVAVLADGLDPSNVDLQRNHAYASGGSPAGTPVISSYQDFSGDGTLATTGGEEAFGDAASIAAQGNTVYDISQYVSSTHPLPSHCDIRIVGDAPGASVLALKIFGSNNATTGSGFVQAINYAVANGASVINESFGGNPIPDTALDIIRSADEAAVAAGVLVVASSGDGGINSTIGSPATDPGVLAVGATTTFRAYQQTTYGGINAPGSTGNYYDNNISSISSGGFSTGGRTVSLVAPGDLNWSLCSTSGTYQDCAGAPIVVFGGTSEASPLTAGAAADVIQAYAATHHGQHPSVALLTRILTSSARDIYAPADQQGAGLLNVGAAVALARSIPGTTAHPAASLLTSVAQADLAGKPGQGVAQHFTVTNTGAKTTVVTVAARGLVPAGAVAGHVVLDPSLGTSQPKFTIWSGAKEIYQRATFNVPKGLDRLKLMAAYTYTNQTSLLHVALFDPHGNFAGYSLPQGLGDFADVEVASPVPGKWTAVYFTVWDGFGSGNLGTVGAVPWTATFWKYHALGSLSPSKVTLPAGRAVGFVFRAALPSSPGDAAVSLSIGSTTTAPTTIPVVLRTFIPIGASGGTYHGVLTGGNGRPGAPGQLNTYEFTVPAGKHDLDASIKMASNAAAGLLPGDQVIGALIDPANQVAAFDSNYTGPRGSTVVSPYLNLYKSNPVAGTWKLVIEWAQPGAGARTAIGFAGAIRFNQVTVSNNLPNSAAAQLSKATGADFQVQVQNTGVAPMIISPDPRTTNYQVFTLSDLFGSPLTQNMPNASNSFFVPTEAKSINIQVAGQSNSNPMEVTFDASSATGDPDFSPTSASPDVTGSVTTSLASATYAPSTGVTPGIWGVQPAEIGPYGSTPEPTGTETTQFQVQALGFDTTMNSSVTPDSVYQLMIGGSINPDSVFPGQTDVITMHIAPTATVGTVVTGTLFVTGLTTGSVFGDTVVSTPLFTSELAAIPYQYQVAN